MTTQQRTRPSPQRLTPVSVENVRRFISTCYADPKKQDLGDVVRVLANTGLRAGELMNLTWACVDFANSRIVVVSGRTMRDRWVQIGPKTTLVLKARYDRGPASEFVFGEARQGLFNRISRQLHEVAKRIGGGPVSFHALRHRFALHLISSGVNIESLMAVMGHNPWISSIKSFTSPETRLRQAAEALARVGEEF